jgi:hypothetical protein
VLAACGSDSLNELADAATGDTADATPLPYPRACLPCATMNACSVVGFQAGCADVEGNEGRGGWYCAVACKAKSECPADHECWPVRAIDGTKASRCIPAAKTCACSAEAAKASAKTPCYVGFSPLPGLLPAANCRGERVCSSKGLSPCSAPPPQAETCNGVDDDCDGATDQRFTATGSLTAAACADDVTCTDDVCAGQNGCTHPFGSAVCSDGNACTSTDTCNEGKCVGGPATVCDDGNACTDDACNLATGCTATANSAACDDGEPCTAPDSCYGGTCKGGVNSCDDGNACTIDSCKTGAGCLYTDATGTCDDGDACTQFDACGKGVCSGEALDCDDGALCTTDTCSPQKGCAHTPVADPECGKALLPLVNSFQCTAPGNGLWTLQHDGGNAAGSQQKPALKWRISPSAKAPGGVAAGCTLHADNGKDMQCGAGQTQVLATATSPELDATAVAQATPVKLQLDSAGSWPAGKIVAQLQVSLFGKAWLDVATVAASAGFQTLQWKLPVQGATFRVRLRLAGVDCATATATGWFVRNVAIAADPCEGGPKPCASAATCKLGTDWKPQCACMPGYAGNGQSCTDIDECKQDPPPCASQALCQNTPGGYTCKVP